MAITLVGTNKVIDNATSDTITLPAGSQEGDVALLTITADNSSNAITPPTGFTVVRNGDVPNSATGAVKLAITYKVLTASEPANYTVNFSIADGHAISFAVFRGVNNDTVLDVSFAFATEPSTGLPPPACPSLTTVTDGSALINIVSSARGPLSGDMQSENFYTAPSGITKIIDANYSSGSGLASHGIGWEEIDPAGSTGTRQWSYIDNDEGGFAGSLAFRPASTVTIVGVGQATETTQTFPAQVRTNNFVATAFETSTATAMRVPRTITVGVGTETTASHQVIIEQVGGGLTDWTDFSEYSTSDNVLLDDWTLEEGGTATLTVQSDSSLPWGRRVRFDLTNAGSHSTAVWNDAPSAEDWDVLILTRRHEVDAHVFGAAARWDETANEGYIGGPNLNTTEVTIRRQQPSGTSTVQDAAHRGITPTNYFWLRLRVRGTATQLRVWQADTSLEDAGRSNEPDDWDIDTTDSVITGSGVPGIHFRQVGTSNRTMDVGWFAYGTGTRRAPGPASERIAQVGLATETSAAVVVADKLASRIDKVLETDTANPALAVKRVAIEQVTSQTAASSVTFELNLVLGQAQETSLARPMFLPRRVTMVRADGIVTAHPVLALRATLVRTAAESSTAPSLGSGAKLAFLGQATEATASFRVQDFQTEPFSTRPAREQDSATAVSGSKVATVGQAVESNDALATQATQVTLINLGLATESDSAGGAGGILVGGKRRFLGLAWDFSRAPRLDSGLPPFWWEFYDQAEGKPSKRKLRPLVFTDAEDGEHYIIMRNTGDNLIHLEPFEPKPHDEVYSPDGGPTIEVDNKLYRLYVSGGVLHFERSLFNVRTRPVLFGKVARPTPKQPRYELVMLAAEL